MEKDKKQSLDMASELFTAPVQKADFLVPPWSKEECIGYLKSRCKPGKKIKALSMLTHINHFEGAGKGGRYTDEGCEELISIMKKCLSDIRLREDAANIALREGAHCEQVGDIPKAAKFYKVSLIYELDDARSRYFQFNNLGFCLNFMEKFSEAEKLLRKAVEIMPFTFNAWKNLGVSLEHQGQYEEAADCYLRAIICSNGEHRSVWHLERLIERHPSLRKIKAIEEWESNLQK